ncbi:MAG: sigma-54 dependent transcriptional regulator [Bacteroidetes bacterium]|nr:sigma-54 dependent transcriptional regulator [Bacteroidota bacterium]MBU2506509.1 sigma-54 dependent transcriptional regulator [Bacteroidota bacterium]
MNNNEIKILIVDDDEIVRESLFGWFEEDGYFTETAKNAVEAINKINATRWDIYFLDIKMPGMDGMELHKRIRDIDKDAIVMMITAYASVETAVQALKEGAFDYITKPFDPDYLSHLVKNAVKQKRLTTENIKLKDSLKELVPPPDIIGGSVHIKEIKKSIAIVAPTSTTVMIRGESGTGKELVAQAIHCQSDRKFLPMVSVNCGAFSETLLESELFGHEKGSFTGALYKRKGKLEIANGGTLFLDEIGAIQPKTQVDLLRAIESKEFSRLGGNDAIKSDFRIICATNSNLEEAVKKGLFREDLFYRINVYVIQLKPLRERNEDIPDLVIHFISKYRKKMNKMVDGIDSLAMDLLLQFEWMGNVRELENSIERAMVVAKKHLLMKEDFLLNSQMGTVQFNSNLSLAEVEKKHIINVVESNKWNISLASKILCLDRATIYKKLKSYGINRPEDA